MGAAWVYAPGRWQTADGCVPVSVVWAYFLDALEMGHARTALDTARGIGLAFGGDEAGRLAWSAMLDAAYPDSAALLVPGDVSDVSDG